MAVNGLSCGKTDPTADGIVEQQLPEVLGMKNGNLKVMKRFLLWN